MMLMQIIEATGARITGGSEYLWNCYGPNARFLDFADQDHTECASVVFDSKTQQVYQLEMHVLGYDQAFAWRNPSYESAYQAECAERNVEPNVAWDDVMYEMVPEDIAMKYLRDIVGTYYDDLPVPEGKLEHADGQ
jgi:hypothetical protein